MTIHKWNFLLRQIGFSALLVIALAFILEGSAFCATPPSDLQEAKRQIEMIMQRVSDKQRTLRALDGQAQQHLKSLSETEEFLKNKDKEQSYFEGVVGETESQINRWGDDIENEKVNQANREKQLRNRLKAFAACAAPVVGRGASRPRQTAAALALMARCRQLSLQAKMGRDSLASYENELNHLRETRERYSTFTKLAQTDLTDVEQQVQKSRLSLDKIEDLKKQRSAEIEDLQKEHERMSGLLQKLVKAEEERKKKAEAARLALLRRQQAAKKQTTVARKEQSAAADPVEVLDNTPDYTMDFTAPANTPVRALESGFVVFAGPYEGWETHVLVKHKDGVISSYRYLKNNAVSAGINVFKGMVIGWVGPLKGTSKNGVQIQIYHEGDTELIPIDPKKWGPSAKDPAKVLLAPEK